MQNGDCRANEEEYFTPRSGVIMQDQVLIHLPVWSNPYSSLLLTSVMSAHVTLQ